MLKSDEVVILDMEAGIEHLGRGTAMGVDLMAVVVEPGRRSLETAHRIRGMAADTWHPPFRTDPEQVNRHRRKIARGSPTEFGADNLLGVIPFDARIRQRRPARCSTLELGDRRTARSVPKTPTET